MDAHLIQFAQERTPFERTTRSTLRVGVPATLERLKKAFSESKEFTDKVATGCDGKKFPWSRGSVIHQGSSGFCGLYSLVAVTRQAVKFSDYQTVVAIQRGQLDDTGTFKHMLLTLEDLSDYNTGGGTINPAIVKGLYPKRNSTLFEWDTSESRANTDAFAKKLAQMLRTHANSSDKTGFQGFVLAAAEWEHNIGLLFTPEGYRIYDPMNPEPMLDDRYLIDCKGKTIEQIVADVKDKWVSNNWKRDAYAMHTFLAINDPLDTKQSDTTQPSGMQQFQKTDTAQLWSGKITPAEYKQRKKDKMDDFERLRSSRTSQNDGNDGAGDSTL